MSSSTALTAPQARGAGLRHTLRAEWTKIVSLRSARWALAATVVGTMAVCVLSTRSALHHPARWYQGFDPTGQSMAGLALGSLLIGILGIMVITGEYGSGTIRASLAATPRRGSLLSAKVIVVGLLALVMGEVLSFASYALGHVVLGAGQAPTATLGQPGVLRVVVESGAFLSLLALLGLGIGVVVRHTVGAIAVFVGVTLLLPALLQRGDASPGRFTPEVIYGNSVADVIRPAGSLSPTVGFLLMTAYTVAILCLGATLFERRDA